MDAGDGQVAGEGANTPWNRVRFHRGRGTKADGGPCDVRQSFSSLSRWAASTSREPHHRRLRIITAPEQRGPMAMSEQPDVRLKGWEPQKLNTSYAKDAVWTKGLRDWVEYRNLGIGEATGGQIHAHVIRHKEESHGHHATTGLHRHLCDFQMNYCLKGWIKFVYEGHEGSSGSKRAIAGCSRRESSTTRSRFRTISRYSRYSRLRSTTRLAWTRCRKPPTDLSARAAGSSGSRFIIQTIGKPNATTNHGGGLGGRLDNANGTTGTSPQSGRVRRRKR